MNDKEVKRAFLSGPRHILPYIRRIQMILEQRTDYLWFTYTNERLHIEGTRESLLLTRNDVEAMITQETRSLSIDIFIFVEWSIWHRGLVLDFKDDLIMSLSRSGKQVYFIDIDECFEKNGDELDIYLASALERALNGEISDYWNQAEQRNKADKNNLFEIFYSLPKREQDAFNMAIKIINEFGLLGSYEDTIYAMRETQGEVIALIYYLQTYNIAKIGLGMVNRTGNNLVDGLLRFFDWGIAKRENHDELINSFNRLLFDEFHMYPPYIPRGTVFLSHNTLDLKQVRQLQLRLETLGYRTFTFRLASLESLDARKQEDAVQIFRYLGAEVQTADYIVCLISANFEKSAWTMAEEVFSAHLNKPIVRITLSESENISDEQIISFIKTASPAPVLELNSFPLPILPYLLPAHALLGRIENLTDENVENEFIAVLKELDLPPIQHENLAGIWFSATRSDFQAILLAMSWIVYHRKNTFLDLEERINHFNHLLFEDAPLTLPWD